MATVEYRYTKSLENKMYMEILFLASPALILLGLCNLTEKTVTIRHSESTRYKQTDFRFK